MTAMHSRGAERLPGVAGSPHLLLVEDDPGDAFLFEELLTEVQPNVQITVASTLAEVPRLIGFAFRPVEFDDSAWEKVMAKDGARESLGRVRDALAEVAPFDEPHVEEALRHVAEETGAKPGKLFQPIRVAITGKTVSAGIFESLVLLGRDEAIRRIDAALARM